MVKEMLSKELIKRRTDLMKTLEKQNVNLEKQHQIYGAINEIDLFLESLEYYNKTSVDDAEFNLARPPEYEKDIFTKLFDNVKDKIKSNR